MVKESEHSKPPSRFDSLSLRSYKEVPPAFENSAWLRKPSARLVRILSEFLEPENRLEKYGVKSAVLVCGSARTLDAKQFATVCADLQRMVDDPTVTESARKAAEDELMSVRKLEWAVPLMDVVEELSSLITHWSMDMCDDSRLDSNEIRHFFSYTQFTSYQPLVLATGGGPGFMLAANRGASRVSDGISIGIGVDLPFERGCNHFVTSGLDFKFNYFFTRKFWMVNLAKALIVAPGGFGTLDELFETLTLLQVGRIRKMPVVFIGKEFWQSIIQWDKLVEYGTIGEQDVASLFFTDSAIEAFEFIKQGIEQQK